MRTFLAALIGLLLGLLVLHAQSGGGVILSGGRIGRTVTAGTGRSILAQSDLTLLGRCDAPVLDGSVGYGLAGRYVAGVLTLIVTTAGSNNGPVWEVNCSGFSTTNPPVATFPAWGGSYGSVFNQCLQTPGNSGCNINRGSLWYDTTLGRLCSNMYNPYDTQQLSDYNFQCNTFNDVSHVMPLAGCYGFNAQQHIYGNGITDVPSWFTSQYLGAGERAFAGFGGYHSGNNTVAGPGLGSFIPDTGTNGCPSTISYLGLRAILSYPFATYPGPPAPFKTSFIDYTSVWSGGGLDWNPIGAQGYWTEGAANDQRGLAVSISTTNVQGLLVLPLIGSDSINTTILSSPAPTTSSATLTSVVTTDGTNLQPGDMINLQNNSGAYGYFTGGISTVVGNAITWFCSANCTPAPVGGGIAYADSPAYINATGTSLRRRVRWQVIDLNDLGKIINGQLASNGPAPTNEWDGVFDGSNNYFPGATLPFLTGPFGMWFDTVTNRLIVGINGRGANSIAFYAYQVR